MKMPTMVGRSSLHLAVVALLVLGTSYLAFAQLGGAAGVRLPYTGVLERDGAEITGTVDFRFDVWNQEVGGTSSCFTSDTMPVLVTVGKFSVVIGPITPACVTGRDVWLEITVNDGNGDVTLPGRQRVYPALASMTSGSGDFHVGGALTVTGTTTTGALAVAGDAVITGTTFLGYYTKHCYGGDPGANGHCVCNNNDRVMGGGPDCENSGGEGWAVVYSHQTGTAGWYSMCDRSDVVGTTLVPPTDLVITCARIR